MSLLSTVKTDENIQEAKDTLGSGRYIYPSDVYPATIKLVYLDKAASGAISFNIVADIGDKEYKEALYISNKNGENFYVDKEKNKHYLAGFLHADGICLLTTGKSVLELPTEKKIVKLYNFKAKQELPTEVEVFTDLVGKEIQIAILESKEYKSVKQDDGTYVPTSEVMQRNSIEKVFHAAHGKTVAECRAKAEKAEFIDEWKNTWAGNVRDKTKGVTPTVNNGTAGAPTGAAPISAPSGSSLFN